MIFTLTLVAILIGTLMPIQAGLNAELTRFIKHPYLGALISFFTGFLALSIIVLLHKSPLTELKRLPEANPVLFLGGILGALFVGSSIFLIPRMGATSMIAAFVTGQLLMSVVIDHYGLLGIQSTPLGLTRVIGVVLLFAGLYLILKKAA
ncbi:MAG TPA: DMT family transporter [Bacteriovoracaceae bacterium]|nr:DMT family transporter [Bacteriovoracaceae bacterium]